MTYYIMLILMLYIYTTLSIKQYQVKHVKQRFEAS